MGSRRGDSRSGCRPAGSLKGAPDCALGAVTGAGEPGLQGEPGLPGIRDARGLATRRQDWCRPEVQTGDTGSRPESVEAGACRPAEGPCGRRGAAGGGGALDSQPQAPQQGRVRRAPSLHLCETEGSARL